MAQQKEEQVAKNSGFTYIVPKDQSTETPKDPEHWCAFYETTEKPDKGVYAPKPLRDALEKNGFEQTCRTICQTGANRFIYKYESPKQYAKFVKIVKEVVDEKKMHVECIMLVPWDSLTYVLVKGNLGSAENAGYHVRVSPYKNHLNDEVVEAEIASFSHFAAKK